MVAADLGRSFASGYLFVANMLNTVTIDNLLVPELVQSGYTAKLDCQYTVLDDRFTLQWLFNRSEVVYEWRPGTNPKVSGILEGRLDLDYKVSNISTQERRALRIVQLEPELSGEYTCRVRSAGADASRTAAMLVFSPEREFVLDVQHELANDSDILDIRCIARGLYPQPDLTIEYNRRVVPQQQRVWRAGALFCAESAARLRARGGRAVCRLLLPPAGYSALRSYTVPSRILDRSNNVSNDFKTNQYSPIILCIGLTLKAFVSR